jgi:hypothetical protein
MIETHLRTVAHAGRRNDGWPLIANPPIERVE